MWPFGQNADKIRNHAFDEFSKGLECFGAKNREQALKHFRRAIKIKPDEGVFHMRIAATLEALGKIEEAKSEYEKAINLMPGSGEPYFLLGNMQRDQGKIIDATNSYEKALSLSLEPPFDEICKNALISLRKEIEKNEAHEKFKTLVRELLQTQKRGGNVANFFHENKAKMSPEEFFEFSRILMVEIASMAEIPPWERAGLMQVISSFLPQNNR